MKNYCKHWYTSWRCSRLAGMWTALFVVMSLLLFMTASYAQSLRLGTGQIVDVRYAVDATNNPLTHDPANYNPACVRQFTPPRGEEYWDVRGGTGAQGHIYTVRIEGVTECDAETIKVHIFNPNRRTNDPGDRYRPQCVDARRVAPGAYEFNVEFKCEDSKTYYVRYCTNDNCDESVGFIARRSDGQRTPAVLRLAHFDPLSCAFIREDKEVGNCPENCPGPKADLPCNPNPSPRNRDAFQAQMLNPPQDPDHPLRRLYEQVLDYAVEYEGVPCTGCNRELLQIVDARLVGDPIEVGDCRYQIGYVYFVLDYCEWQVTQIYGFINWKEDDDAPEIVNAPSSVDLGCNPKGDQTPDDWMPNCDLLIEQYDIYATDNCDGRLPRAQTPDEVGLYCVAGYRQSLGKCRYSMTFRFTARDRCGNVSQPVEVTVTWKVDTERPRLENVPRGVVDLGCNPKDDQTPDDWMPSRDWLIERFNIRAVDNCTDGGHNYPQIEGEPVSAPEALGKCTYQQVWRFRAVAKESCPDYQYSEWYTFTVKWKVDTERPRLVNLPAPCGGVVNLGCNPKGPNTPVGWVPDCNWLIEQFGISAEDNCSSPDNPPSVECEPVGLPQEAPDLGRCWYRQTFRFRAVGKAECPDYRYSEWCEITFEWKVDRQAPQINQLPASVKLPCNFDVNCDNLKRYLRERYQVVVKDNCDENLDLQCEPAGEREPAGACEFRQTFRFFAVDSCGNISEVRLVTFLWKEDRTPPVIDPDTLPPGGDLGCNPQRLPVCEDFQVRAKDDCAGAVPVSCSYRDTTVGCLRFRVFTFTAADECGNATTETVTYFWTVDTTPPQVRCPEPRVQEITVQADPKECLKEVELTLRGAKAHDDCDPNPRVECDAVTMLLPIGVHDVEAQTTCRAVDRCGNVGTATCTIRARVTVLGFIQGYKFHDLDGDGIWDANEPGLAGWTMELLDAAGNVLQTTQTDENGYYVFLGLPAGTYSVREVLQPGWVNTTPNPSRPHVLPRDCGKKVNFGNRRTQ